MRQVYLLIVLVLLGCATATAQTLPQITPLNMDPNFALSGTFGFSVLQDGNEVRLYSASTIPRKTRINSDGTTVDMINTTGCQATDVTNLRPECIDSISLFWKNINPYGSNLASKYNDLWNGYPGMANLATYAHPTRTPVWPPATGLTPIVTHGITFLNALDNPSSGNEVLCHMSNPSGKYTGTANAKVVKFNSTYYMAFNAQTNAGNNGGVPGWSGADRWRIFWAKSTDGKSWKILPEVLFRTALEALPNQCPPVGALVTDLIIDKVGTTPYFFLLMTDVGTEKSYLLRAPVNASAEYGVLPGTWQIAVGDSTQTTTAYRWFVPEREIDPPADRNRYKALNLISPSPLLCTGTCQAAEVMKAGVSGGGIVKQAAIARVWNSTSPTSARGYIGLATSAQRADGSDSIVQVWYTNDLSKPFVKTNGWALIPKLPRGAFGWEFGFTHYPDNYSTPRIIASMLDIWFVGRATSPWGYQDTLVDHTIYRMRARIAGTPFTPARVARFKTALNYYLTSSSNPVRATATAAGTYERFTIIDLNGGALQNGDAVHLVTANGTANNANYVVANNGGGSTLSPTATNPNEWETFRIWRTAGAGTVVSGDLVSLSAYNGMYIAAEWAGGGEVNANRTSIGDWERFTITFN